MSADSAEGHYLIDSFEQCAARHPNNIALVLEDGRTVTYKKLDALANDIAKVLSQYVMNDNISNIDTPKVFITMGRDTAFVASVLAILKVNAAYVPIDPSFPVDRQSYIFTHSKASLLLTDRESYKCAIELGVDLPLTFILDLKSGVIVDCSDTGIRVDDIKKEYWYSSYVRPERIYNDDRLFYILYTSGSTGKPKGVCVRQVSVKNTINYFRDEMGVNTRSVVMGLTTFNFDISVLEIFLPLTNGCQLVIVENQTRKNPFRIIELIEKYGINVFQATPTTYEMLLLAGWTGNSSIDFLVGGEAFRSSLLQFLENCKSFRNAYGPTETTIYSTCFNIPKHFSLKYKDDKSFKLPIGSAITETVLYLVKPQDSSNENAASCNDFQLDDSEGELWIGGIGVANGYHNAPELSTDRFLQDPFIVDSDQSHRVYRTGDLVKRHKIEGCDDIVYTFIRRLDDQVKVDGYRIELQEIENVFMKSNLVSKAVAVVRKNTLGLYIKTNLEFSHSLSEEEERDMLEKARRALTTYMIPKYIVYMQGDFPTSPTGKLDRNALPEYVKPTKLFGDDLDSKIDNADRLAVQTISSKKVTIINKIIDAVKISNGMTVGPNASIASVGIDSLGSIILVKVVSSTLGNISIDPTTLFAPEMTVKKFAFDLQKKILADKPDLLNQLNIDILNEGDIESANKNTDDSDTGDNGILSQSPIDVEFDKALASNITFAEGVRGIMTFFVLWNHYRAVGAPKQLSADTACFMIMTGFSTALQLRSTMQVLMVDNAMGKTKEDKEKSKYIFDIESKEFIIQQSPPFNWKSFLVSRLVGVLPIFYMAILLSIPYWYIQDNPKNANYYDNDRRICIGLYIFAMESWYMPECDGYGPNYIVYGSILVNVFIIYAFTRYFWTTFLQPRFFQLNTSRYIIPYGTYVFEEDMMHSSIYKTIPFASKVGIMLTKLTFNRTKTFDEALNYTIFWSTLVLGIFIAISYYGDFHVPVGTSLGPITLLPYFIGGAVSAAISECWLCAFWYERYYFNQSNEYTKQLNIKNDGANMKKFISDEENKYTEQQSSEFYHFQSNWLNYLYEKIMNSNDFIVWKKLKNLLKKSNEKSYFDYKKPYRQYLWQFLPDAIGALYGYLMFGIYNNNLIFIQYFINAVLPFILLIFLTVSFIQKGNYRKNISRFIVESPLLSFLGYISYTSYVFQREILEFYYFYFKYAFESNNGNATLRFTPSVNTRSLFREESMGMKFLAVLIHLIFCYLIQKYVQDTFISMLYVNTLKHINAPKVQKDVETTDKSLWKRLTKDRLKINIAGKIDLKPVAV